MVLSSTVRVPSSWIRGVFVDLATKILHVTYYDPQENRSEIRKHHELNYSLLKTHFSSEMNTASEHTGLNAAKTSLISILHDDLLWRILLINDLH